MNMMLGVIEPQRQGLNAVSTGKQVWTKSKTPFQRNNKGFLDGDYFINRKILKSSQN